MLRSGSHSLHGYRRDFPHTRPYKTSPRLTDVEERNSFDLHQYALVSLYIPRRDIWRSSTHTAITKVIQIDPFRCEVNHRMRIKICRCTQAIGTLSLPISFGLTGTQSSAQVYATAAQSLRLYLTHFPSCGNVPEIDFGTDYTRFTIGDVAKFEGGVSHR
jgi:hypothetical protein